MPDLYRRYGQVFLRNASVARAEARALSLPAGSNVVEIGPGTGILTAFLLDIGYYVKAVETDHRFIDVLRERFSAELGEGRLSIVKGNILDFPGVLNTDGIAGNIPYSISSPLFELLCKSSFRFAVLMFQREFGEKLLKLPGQRGFSRISALSYLNVNARRIRNVPRTFFTPAPKVDSIILRFERKEMMYPDKYEDILRTAFAGKRKKLKNVLPGLPPELGDMRIEELGEVQFLKLLDTMRNTLKEKKP